MVRLLSIGDNCIDNYVELSRHFPGGNALNVAVYSNRIQGVEADYIGVIGTDDAGNFLLDQMKSEGLSVEGVLRLQGKTAVTNILIRDGERIFADYIEGIQKDATFPKSILPKLRRYDVIHYTVWGWGTSSSVTSSMSDAVLPPMCQGDADCGAGEVCHVASGECYVPEVSGCTDNSGCAADELCEVETGTCVPGGCTADADCPAGKVCNVAAGVCETPIDTGCNADVDCALGLVCNVETGECENVGTACSIDTDCPVGQVRTFVAGTDETTDALADSQIPQTAAVKRDQQFQVTYDGIEPRFKTIEGTPLAFAVNQAFLSTQ